MRALAWMWVALLPALSAERKPGPPLWVDRDDRPIPKPREQRVSELNDILYNTWLRHLSPEHKVRCARDSGALNVNAWDEAPDSSWFTNRIGRKPLSFDQIVEGIEGSPPAPPPWRVLRVIDEGYTPKLHVADSAGRTYVLKFDPGAPERNSGAERVSTLLFHAAGYNVPHNSLVRFGASDLRLDERASYRDAVGRRRAMTQADLDATLARLKSLAGGKYRGVASQFISGADLGKFSYCGTRPDDANDIIPHEYRRELRGLRVIASWANHADTGDKNTFDAYTGEDGKGYVRHYLLDFGSTLGSGDYTNGPFRVGHEYLFDAGAMAHTLVTLGIWRRPWETRGVIRYPEIGYYEADLFAPAEWRPNYPNLAFERLDDGDGYWGAKIVTAFDDTLVRRLAEAAEYSRQEATRYLAETMRRRRDAVGHYWLDRVTPLEDFRLEGGMLSFRDLAVERGFAEAPRQYRLDGKREFVGTRVDVAGRLQVSIQSRRRDGRWARPVAVFLDSAGVRGWRR
jgi:hypothetical protein